MVNNMTDLTAQEPARQTRDHLDDPVIGELRNRFWAGCLYCSGDSHRGSRCVDQA